MGPEKRRRTGKAAAQGRGGSERLLPRFSSTGLPGGDLHHFSDHSRWIELPGFALLVVSTAFTLWARFRLGRMWSASPNVLRTGHQLRTDGPYSITRHPIYTGLFGMLLGTVLLNGIGASLAFLIIGAAVLATRIPIEERLMSKTFPDEYARYRKRVPMFVPGVQLLRRSH
jgi:protein-S-isoprenylcysteine O-methyltransferase Ste14